MTQVSERLVRLLNMVPYFQANPQISHEEAAAELGVTRKQLLADLNQLWMCGLPGGGPGDLIDLDFDGDNIEVIFSAGMDRALRLTSPEATGILVALRALLDVPGILDPEAARSAIAKIESAAGATLAVEDPTSTESAPAAAVRAATRSGRALSIEYHSASHDAVSVRVVDPIRVVLVGDTSYLEAWCRAATAGSGGADGSSSTSLFDADPSLPSATLRIDRSASWMFDYYPLRVVRELPGGAFEAAMTYASDAWMSRFVLGFGSAVRVLEPAELAARVRESATAALHAYEDG